MTTNSPSSSRRGLAISSVVAGALATVMIVAFWLIAGGSDGQGLSTGSVLAVLFFYAAPVIGAIAVLLGIVAAIISRSKLLAIVGIVLGAVPIVAVLVSQFSAS